MEIEKNFSEENEARKSACSNRQDQSISITPLGIQKLLQRDFLALFRLRILQEFVVVMKAQQQEYSSKAN